MPTENHQYETPGRGATDWDVQVNANTTKLDTDVEIRDADANKANYEPKDGAQFRATDTGAIYAGDGTNWVKQDVEVATAAVGQLTDTADGQPWETLHAAGYDTGDRVHVQSVTTLEDSTFTTASGTFTNLGSTSGFVLANTDHVPADATLEGRMLIESWSTMDTTGEFRGEFIADDGTAVETPLVSTATTFERLTTGWVEIPDREMLRCRPLVRSSDGTNSVSCALATFELAVVL